jgi:hypothetical protein
MLARKHAGYFTVYVHVRTGLQPILGLSLFSFGFLGLSFFKVVILGCFFGHTDFLRLARCALGEVLGRTRCRQIVQIEFVTSHGSEPITLAIFIVLIIILFIEETPVVFVVFVVVFVVTTCFVAFLFGFLGSGVFYFFGFCFT